MGTFDRDHAVEDETIDYFASGHALVEGLLMHFEEDPKGTRGASRSPDPWRRRQGVGLDQQRGPQFEVSALDTDASAAGLGGRVAASQEMSSADAIGSDWRSLIARLATQQGDRTPHAVAAIVVRD